MVLSVSDSFQDNSISVEKVTMADAISSAFNYHKWIFDTLKRYFVQGGITLEIGAGHGEYTKLFSQISKKVIATDVDASAVIRMSDELKEYRSVETIHMDGLEGDRIAELVDNIVLINIIEHIRDDYALIEKSHAILNSKGRLIIFAPAFQLLYSEIDKQACHFRRYSKRELEALLENNGFNIVYARYFNFIGFWGWLANKLFGSGVNSKTTNLQVNAFDKCVYIVKLFDVFSAICGQSVIVIGEKNDFTYERSKN